MAALTETQRAVCAVLTENAGFLRRVVQLMPNGNPVPEFLQMLYSYAVQSNHRAELANALLGVEWKDAPWKGEDWFQAVALPENVPGFFILVRKFGWLIYRLRRNLLEEEDPRYLLAFCERFREEVGEGVADFDRVVAHLREWAALEGKE